MTPQEIEQIINMLIEKLGPIGGQVWSIYVKQVYVNVATNLFVSLVCLLALVGALLGLRHCIKEYKRATSKDPYGGKAQLVGAGAVTSATIAAFCGLMVLFCLPEVFQLLNPEYYAIQMLLGR